MDIIDKLTINTLGKLQEIEKIGVIIQSDSTYNQKGSKNTSDYRTWTFGLFFLLFFFKLSHIVWKCCLNIAYSSCVHEWPVFRIIVGVKNPMSPIKITYSNFFNPTPRFCQIRTLIFTCLVFFSGFPFTRWIIATWSYIINPYITACWYFHNWYSSSIKGYP